MKCLTPGAFAALLVFSGCGVEGASVESVPAPATAGPVFKIGLMMVAGSPAAANFTAAATLAESHLNEGLARAGVPYRFQVVAASYSLGQEQDVAIDLVNNQGVLGIVTDTDFTSAVVNQLNYDFSPRIAQHVVISCFQCGSPRFNQPFESDLGYSDSENWLFRTFFNNLFEQPLQLRLVLARPHSGDFNGDGRLKVVVYADIDHYFEALNYSTYLDSLHQGPHAVEVVLLSNAGQPPSQFELDQIFDDHSYAEGNPPDGFPDVIIVAMYENSGVLALGPITSHPTQHPPVQAIEALRRDYLLPALVAQGGEDLEGTSVLRVAESASGSAFRNAFVQATGQEPELTASYLFDAIVLQAGAVAWAVHFDNGDVNPFVVDGNVPNVNDPSGKLIRARPADFELAFHRIDQELPINYDGASSPLDLDFVGDSFPDLVHWKIQGGKFVELERYRCTPDLPNCTRR